MIKSIHKLLVPPRKQEFNALVGFFEALGLERGESWKGRRSRGIKLEAPAAGVEIGLGEGFPEADLVVEVTSADEVYESARRHGFKLANEIADTDWGARMFTVEAPSGTARVAVFSYSQPAKQAETAGGLSAAGRRFAVVAGRFNSFICDRLLAGALDALRRTGAKEKDVRIFRVPGSFEIPAAARALAETGKYDAIICLGCLLRGETAHYEVIANEVTRGIGQSAQETGVPHAFGVLTCDTLEQALDRAGLKSGNKGFEAALAAVEMANLSRVVGRQRQRKTKTVNKAGRPARPPASGDKQRKQ